MKGDGVLDAVAGTLRRYVAWPSRAASDAAALWIAATHAQRVAEHATRLIFSSPTKRCGKSRALDVVGALVRRPLIAANLSPAALYRSLDEADPPTVVLDEADAIFRDGRPASEGREDLRGLLNAGFGRNRPAARYNITTRQVEALPTFAMVALAAIGRLPDTVEDRAIRVTLHRRAAGERVASLRQRDLRALEPLRSELGAWIEASLKALENADPALPVEDREADCWAPLVAVADLAGGNWPDRARRACIALTSDQREDETAAVMLLEDLAALYDGRDADFLPTAEILLHLHQLDERPWGDWGGKPITPRGLARLLRPFGVRSTTGRTATGTPKGYSLAGPLVEALERYAPKLPANPQQAQQAQQTRAAREKPDATESATKRNTATSVEGEPGRVAESIRNISKPQQAVNPGQHGIVADVADVADNPASADTEDITEPLPDFQKCPKCHITRPFNGPTCPSCAYKTLQEHGRPDSEKDQKLPWAMRIESWEALIAGLFSVKNPDAVAIIQDLQRIQKLKPTTRPGIDRQKPHDGLWELV